MKKVQTRGVAENRVGLTPKAKSTIRFSTTPSQIESRYIDLPKSLSAKLAQRDSAQNLIATTIEGTINNLPFQSSIESTSKDGDYRLIVNKSTLAFAAKSKEKTVPVEITKIGNESETRIPIEFQKALASTAQKVRDLWIDITPIARRDWIFWIITAKQEETRTKRAEVACSKLSSGMRRVCCFPGVKWLMKNGK